MTWLLLIALFAGLLFIGAPVVAAIALTAAATLAISLPMDPALITTVQRMATGLDSFSLLAIPLFLFSGELMNRGGAALRLVNLGRAMVGRLPGGLLLVNITACVLFGAISGSAVAATAAIGGFMIPLMERHGLPRPLSAATNLTASTTGLLIPPSNVLIVYALASGGVSVAALFLAGYIPGLLVASALMVVSLVSARQLATAGPAGSEAANVPAFLPALKDALPSLALIVVVMGGIIGGVFTATEAAGISVAYALLLTIGWHRELKPSQLPAVARRTVRTSSVVLLLVAASMALSWVMAYENIPQRLAAALLSLADNPVVLLLLINGMLLAVGTVLDMTPAVLIFTPILLPVVQEIGMDPVHFGIVMVLNLCIGLCTPPVGTVLFVGMATGRVSLRQLMPPLLPLYGALVATLIVVTLVPDLSLWLPRALGF